MKFHHVRSGSGGQLPLLRSSSSSSHSSQGHSCRWCGWFYLIAGFGFLKLLASTTLHSYHLQGDDNGAPFSAMEARFKEEFQAQSSSRKSTRGRPQQLTSWTDRLHSEKTCTKDLHGLIDKQALDRSQKPTLLPDFNPESGKGGGVIVFWHLAKTGGTTVRKQCASLPEVDYLMLLKPEDYFGADELVSTRLTPSSENSNHTLFVEMHGMNAPTVLDLESHMQHWRSLSKKHGTPLFIFTLFREPVTYSLSYFNFFHQTVPKAPSQDILVRSIFNRQCHTLATPGHSKRVCALLYRKLYTIFDWVGTTERMTDETLPLLQHLLRFKPKQRVFAEGTNVRKNFLLPSDLKENHYNVAVPRNVSLSMEDLSPTTIRSVKERTCLDRGLWERAQQDFSLGMWEDTIDGRPS